MNSVVQTALKGNVDLELQRHGDSTHLLSIHGDENIANFHRLRQQSQSQLAKIVGRAGWDDVLPFDGEKDDIAFTDSKGVETGVIIQDWPEVDKRENHYVLWECWMFLILLIRVPVKKLFLL